MSGGELWQLLKENNALPEKLSCIYIAEIALALGKRFKNITH